MRTFLFSILTAVLLTGISFAQTNAQAQGSASGSQNVTASQNGNGAQAQSDTAAQGAADAAVSSPSQNHSAQSSTSNQASSSQAVSNQAATGKTIHATLEKPIDARKSKPGDEVVAKTTQTTTSNEGVAIPKGSKIIGHVTEAKAKQKGESQSAVGVVFDHAVLKNGQQVPMTASIQAISSSEHTASASAFDDAPIMAGTGAGMTGAGAGQATTAGRGLAGGAGSVAGGATNTLGSRASTVNTNTAGTLNGAASGPNGVASSALSSTSHGVTGLNGLSLSTAEANSTEGSVISSASRNVHLDSGTEMILQVTK